MEIQVFVKFTRLHGIDVVVTVAVVVAAVVDVAVVAIKNESNTKVECPKKISPLLQPCFYKINMLILMLILSLNLNLPIIWMSCNCFGCVAVYL